MTNPSRPERGIRSLNQRLQFLEESIENTDQHPNLLKKIQNLEKERKNKELDKLTESFQTTLASYVNDLSDNNVVEILVFTIRYVRQNLINIARLANVKPNKEFEKICVLSFVEQSMGKYSTEMLSMSIETLSDLIFSQKIVDNENETFEDVQKESKFKLFRRGSKKIK